MVHVSSSSSLPMVIPNVSFFILKIVRSESLPVEIYPNIPNMSFFILEIVTSEALPVEIFRDIGSQSVRRGK